MASRGGRSKWALLVALGLAGLGCAERQSTARAPALVPDVGTRVAAMSPTGVTITVDANVPRVAKIVAPDEPPPVPVLIRVENRGQRAVAVRYAGFALRDPNGHVYRAMAPADVEAMFPKPPSLLAVPTFTSTINDQLMIRAEGAPPVWDVPNVSRWETSFPFRQDHWKGFYGKPKTTRAFMSAMLLPEGALESGRSVVGVLYFPDVPATGPDARHLALTADLSASDDGTAVARAVIPMRVTR